MNIKKVDGKPMVPHTKEKPKLHVKGTPEVNDNYMARAGEIKDGAAQFPLPLTSSSGRGSS